MKSWNKKRLEKLEKNLMHEKNRPRWARLLYDNDMLDFDVKSLQLNADIIFALPDNGRRSLNGSCVLKGGYNVVYG